MKSILYISSIIWLCFCTWACAGMLKEIAPQILRDRKFIEEEINPNIKIVDRFVQTQHRLPSVDEFNKIKGIAPNLGNVEYVREEKFLDGDIKSKVANLDWSKNYVLAVWRGDWLEYYLSQNHTYITNNTKESDRFFVIIYSLLFGFIPLILLLFFNRRKLNPKSK